MWLLNFLSIFIIYICREQIEFVFFEDKQREEFKINLIKNLENNPMLSK
jgi:hypothetical protein